MTERSWFEFSEIIGNGTQEVPEMSTQFQGAWRTMGRRLQLRQSSEGSLDYNLRLSERRSQAVVGDLVKRGIAASRLSAVGIGEARPIASNVDESGRTLNRRVEVKCQ